MRQLLTFLFVYCVVATAQAGPSAAKRLQHVPAAVQQTVRTQLGDGKLEHLAKTVDDGQTVYEVTIGKDGKSRDFTIALNGSVLEVEVFLEETPASVRKTILATAKGVPLDDITKSADNGEVTYEVEITKDGVTRDFTVGKMGQLLSVEVAESDTPSAVQKTIRDKTQGAGDIQISKTMDDGEVSYDVEMKKRGKTEEFSVSDDGEYLGMAMELEDLPAVVRKTVRAEAGGGKIGDITQDKDEDGVTYEVEITSGAVTRYVTVKADGSIDSTEQPIALKEAPASVQAALRAQGLTVLNISKISEDGDTSYDIEAIKAGAKQELSLTPDGKPAAD